MIEQSSRLTAIKARRFLKRQCNINASLKEITEAELCILHATNFSHVCFHCDRMIPRWLSSSFQFCFKSSRACQTLSNTLTDTLATHTQTDRPTYRQAGSQAYIQMYAHSSTHPLSLSCSLSPCCVSPSWGVGGAQVVPPFFLFENLLEAAVFNLNKHFLSRCDTFFLPSPPAPATASWSCSSQSVPVCIQTARLSGSTLFWGGFFVLFGCLLVVSWHG